jgi:hypothetical protein
MSQKEIRVNVHIEPFEQNFQQLAQLLKKEAAFKF